MISPGENSLRDDGSKKWHDILYQPTYPVGAEVRKYTVLGCLKSDLSLAEKPVAKLSRQHKVQRMAEAKTEQTTTLSTNNKKFVEFVKALLKDSQDPSICYKVAGHFDSESKTMFFDMEEAVGEAFR